MTSGQKSAYEARKRRHKKLYGEYKQTLAQKYPDILFATAQKIWRELNDTKTIPR